MVPSTTDRVPDDVTTDPRKAVLVEVDVTGVDEDAGLATLRAQIVPAIRSMPGFVAGTWLTGDARGRGLSLTVWDSETHAETFAAQFRPGTGPAANATVLACTVRDVAATATSDRS
jgi:hypothetical protein